jgi:hypothetical protein
MKSHLLTAFVVLLMGFRQSTNQFKMETLQKEQKDSIAISNALENYYFQGIYEGDLNALGQIFNTGTLLFGDVKGQPYAKTLDQYLDGVKHRQRPKDSGKPFKGEILNIKVVNSIAIAEVRVKMYEFIYHEFLSFHKLNGKWLIVNKMISDVNE